MNVVWKKELADKKKEIKFCWILFHNFSSIHTISHHDTYCHYNLLFIIILLTKNCSLDIIWVVKVSCVKRQKNCASFPLKKNLSKKQKSENVSLPLINWAVVGFQLHHRVYNSRLFFMYKATCSCISKINMNKRIQLEW